MMNKTFRLAQVTKGRPRDAGWSKGTGDDACETQAGAKSVPSTPRDDPAVLRGSPPSTHALGYEDCHPHAPAGLRAGVAKTRSFALLRVTKGRLRDMGWSGEDAA